MNYRELLKDYKINNAEQFEAIQKWIDSFEPDEIETPEELAFQLTAYERGYIDIDGFINDLINTKIEELDDYELVKYHNSNIDFVMDNYIYTDINEMLEGEPDAEYIANRIHFGSYHGGFYGYYKFNGYGNVVEDTASALIDMDIVREALKKELPELEEEARFLLLEMTRKLVNTGY